MCLTWSEAVSGLAKPQRDDPSLAQQSSMYSLLQITLSLLLLCTPVLPQTHFALCYTLSNLCKTQCSSSSSVFLCLFFAFILHCVTASIPCYHISPLFLVSPEMHFCTVNICPSLAVVLSLFSFFSLSCQSAPVYSLWYPCIHAYICPCARYYALICRKVRDALLSKGS